ncbi:Remorin 4.1-like protein [Drosera capensis]
MEYERIHKLESGMISPSKLRMKLMGAVTHHNQRPKKDTTSVSNPNSSRTSPSKQQDYSNDSLLDSQIQDDDDDDDLEVSSFQPSSVKLCDNSVPSSLHITRDNGGGRVQQHGCGNVHLSAIHLAMGLEDENPDYDSNASSSSFEFHKGEKGVNRMLTRSFSRPTSYKWYEAEKWIMNKQQTAQANCQPTGNGAVNNRFSSMMNVVRVTPETAGYEHRLPNGKTDNRRVDSCQASAAQMAFDKFSFSHPVAQSISSHTNDLYPESKDLKEVGSTDNSAATAIRAVCMRDMGTEMTPVASHEPSRTATPVGATTPLRSPTSSIPSSPRRGTLESSSMDHVIDCDTHNPTEYGKKELTEQELKLKTRREIVALGVQLGKMNIAAWASKDEKEMSSTTAESAASEEFEREKCAAAWEEAEKSKHNARFKREEIKIQAWECQQKAKLESQMRKMEAKVERMRASAEAKMVKKIAHAQKKSEAKRAAAEAKKNRQAEQTAAQVEYIRQTGRIPSSRTATKISTGLEEHRYFKWEN